MMWTFFFRPFFFFFFYVFVTVKFQRVWGVEACHCPSWFSSWLFFDLFIGNGIRGGMEELRSWKIKGMQRASRRSPYINLCGWQIFFVFFCFFYNVEVSVIYSLLELLGGTGRNLEPVLGGTTWGIEYPRMPHYWGRRNW